MAVMKVGAAGIETMSGALKRPKKQNGHNHGNYLVATHRTAATTNPNCQRVYSFDADRYKRSSTPTANEIAQHEKFTAISQMVNIRKKDLSKINADIAAFKAQKDQPGGKPTMKSWYWMVCGEEYENAQG